MRLMAMTRFRAPPLRLPSATGIRAADQSADTLADPVRQEPCVARAQRPAQPVPKLLEDQSVAESIFERGDAVLRPTMETRAEGGGRPQSLSSIFPTAFMSASAGSRAHLEADLVTASLNLQAPVCDPGPSPGGAAPGIVGDLVSETSPGETRPRRAPPMTQVLRPWPLQSEEPAVRAGVVHILK